MAGKHDGFPYKYDALCKTGKVKSDPYTFVWRITEFSLRTEKKGEALVSEEFTIKGPGDKITKWRGAIYPKGEHRDDEEYLSLYLINQTKRDVDAKFVFYLLDANNVKKCVR